MEGKKFYIVSFLYGLTLFLLIIYTYSQIDLNLTLSGNHFYQSFQKQLILLGYYNRPLSAFFYLAILLSLFCFYIYITELSRKGLIKVKHLKRLLIMHIVLAVFSYPAFSHDFFNYMFDARIVTKYFANPYMFKALDFPYDPWIRFMHWTHRTYPYGPLWLILTIPFSLVGAGKFVLTMVNFKILFIIFHLGNVYLIYKITQKMIPKNSNTVLPLCIFALNPLIIIESLISPHNEVVMLFFLLVSIYFLIVQKKNIHAVFFLFLSAAVKFITLIAIPLYFIPSNKLNGKKALFIRALIIVLLIPLAWEIRIREPYPWYFILILGLAALLKINKYLLILISGISCGLLLRYTTYIYTGDYKQYTVMWQNLLFVIPLAVSLIWIIFNFYMTRGESVKS